MAVGQFTPTQIIVGAVVTCTSVVTNVNLTSCDGLKVNGLDMGGVTIDPAPMLCSAIQFLGPFDVTGKAFGPPSLATRFVWNGTTWVLVTANAQSITGIQCQ